MMNLATRCTACGTIFRVVQDQLKVSDGWVRCGRCQAVFNAQQGLFDLEREAPPPWEPAAAPPDASSMEEPTQASESTAIAAGEIAAEPEADEHDALESPDVERTGIEPTAEAEHDESAADAASAFVEATALQTDEKTEGEVAAEPAPATTDDESAPATPDFVRQAERDKRWDRTPVRAALGLIAVLAALCLALQITGHYRQRIAAQWPTSTPWLQRYCAVFGCRLDTLRRIDDVSIESTALTQADASQQGDSTPNTLRLAVTLRNRGELPIAMPSVDLSLTGADGELVSRRSLSPADFQVGDPRLTPGVDAPLSVSFSVTGRRVSGYTVEVFYP